MHSIELLLDSASDAAIRREWQALSEAGLPSQADHSGETNAPHVTLLARARIDASFDQAVERLFHDLPLPGRLGTLVVFGGPPRGLVLARPVVATTSILDLQRAVHDLVAPDDGPEDAPHTFPGRWTPHVTLASRLTPAQLAEAVDVLAGLEPTVDDVMFATARRWDPTARTITEL